MAVGRASLKPVPPKPPTRPGENGRTPGEAAGAAGGAAAGLDPKQHRLEQTRQTLDAKLKQDQVTTQRPRTASSDKLQAFAEASIISGEHQVPTTATPPRVARGLGGGASAGAGLEAASAPTASSVLADPGRLVDGARELVDKVKDTGQQLAEQAAERVADEIARRTGMGSREDMKQPEPQDMKEGDVYTFEVGVSAGGEHKNLEAGGGYGMKIEMERGEGAERDTYRLRTNLNVNLNVGATKGDDGVKASGDAKIETEYEFPSAAEAKKGQEMLGVLARHPARCVMSGEKPATMQELAEAQQYLAKYQKSITLEGKNALEVAKSLNLPVKGVELPAGDLALKGEVSQQLKINFENGQAKTAEFSTTLTGEGSFAPKLGLDTGDGGFSVKLPASKGSVAVTEKVTVDIPPGVSAQELSQDPVGALRSRAEAMQKSARHETSVKLSVENAGHGHDFEATLQRSNDPAKNREALQRLVQGDFDGARQVDGVDLKLKHTEWKKRGLQVEPELDLKVVKVGSRVESTTRSIVAKHEWPPPPTAGASAGARLN